MAEEILTTTEDFPGSYEILGFIHGTSIRAGSLVKDARETVRNLIGGEMVQYGKLIDDTVDQATGRMLERAKELGADAVIGIRIATPNVVVGGAEIVVYGTAIRYKSQHAG